MAKDILKEAIADAKAVREVALANAKAALEEAFTPKLQSMLSAKLSEELNEEEDLEETYMDEDMDETMDEEKDMDETMDEITGMDEKEDLDEEIDLEEILNELELEEGEVEEETVDEAKDEDLDEAKKDDKEDVKEADDKDLDEAKDDEKEMEEAVGYPNYRADQMRKVRHDATDINQGLNEGEEFDLDALLEEINNLDEKKDEDDVKEAKDMDETMDETYMDEEMDENLDEENPVTGRPFGARTGPSDSSLYMFSLLPKSAAKGMKPEFAKVVGTRAVDSHDEFVKALNAKGMRSRTNFKNFKQYFTESELDEVKAALEVKTAELNEVNLLNSKLLYVNRIFKANQLDESQKLRVVETLDKAESTKEAKLIYETIKDTFNVAKSKKESVKTKTKSLKEGLGIASKAAGTSTAPKSEIISESTSMVNRFQKLANIKINQ